MDDLEATVPTIEKKKQKKIKTLRRIIEAFQTRSYTPSVIVDIATQTGY